MRKVLLVAMLVMLVSCGQSADKTADINEPIEDALGITPYLPETDYPIGLITIEYSQIVDNGAMTKGDPSVAKVHYLMSTDEIMDEEWKQAWEDKHPFEEIVYGDLYMDPTAIIVTIAPDGVGELTDAELIEIDGKEVQYQYISRDSETVFIAMNFDDIGYQIQYSADIEDIEEEAKAFAEEIIKNN